MNGSRAPTPSTSNNKSAPTTTTMMVMMTAMTTNNKKKKKEENERKNTRKSFLRRTNGTAVCPTIALTICHTKMCTTRRFTPCEHSYTTKNYYTIQCFYGLYSPTRWLTRYRTDRFPYAVASQHIWVCLCVYARALCVCVWPTWDTNACARSTSDANDAGFGSKRNFPLSSSGTSYLYVRRSLDLLGNNHMVRHERQWIIISLETCTAHVSIEYVRSLRMRIFSI